MEALLLSAARLVFAAALVAASRQQESISIAFTPADFSVNGSESDDGLPPSSGGTVTMEFASMALAGRAMMGEESG